MGEMVAYRSDAGTGEGYLATPDDPPGAPAVVLIQEDWCLAAHITALADRFAGAGFVALAPDLLRGLRAGGRDDTRRLLMGLAMDRAAKEIAIAAGYVADRPEAGAGVGAVGFCMGGSLALWSATFSDRISAAVGFYPALPWERMSAKWEGYAGKSALIHCSEAGGLSAAPGVRSARTAIEQAGGGCTVYEYPGTAHAFFNDDRPEAYDAYAARSAWARTVGHLRGRL